MLCLNQIPQAKELHFSEISHSIYDEASSLFQDTEGKLLSLSENYNVRNDAECLEKLWKQAYTISIEVNFFSTEKLYYRTI